MSGKRRVKLPGRFEEEQWFVVQYTMDEELSDPLTAAQLEDENDRYGDDICPQMDELWFAPWRDGQLYEGKVVHMSATKEAAMKFRKGFYAKKKPTKKKRSAADVNDDAASKKKKETAKKRTRLVDLQTESRVSTANQIFAACLHSAKHQPNSVTPTNQAQTATPQPHFATPTPQPHSATSTLQPHSATPTPQPHSATSTPQPHSATATPQPHSATPQPHSATHQPHSATSTLQPHSATSTLQPHSATSTLQPHSATCTLQPHSATSTLQPHSATPTPQPHSATSTLQPHSATCTLQPHSATSTLQPHSATSTPQPHSATPTPQPHSATATPQPHSATSTLQPHSATSTLQPHSATSTLQPHSATSTLKPHSATSTLQPHSATSTPQPHSATPQPHSATPQPHSATLQPHSATSTPQPHSATPQPHSATPQPHSATATPQPHFALPTTQPYPDTPHQFASVTHTLTSDFPTYHNFTIATPTHSFDSPSPYHFPTRPSEFATLTHQSDLSTPNQLFATTTDSSAHHQFSSPHSNIPSSFMSMLSDVTCNLCIQKEEQIKDQNKFILTLTQDVEYWRGECEKAKNRKDRSPNTLEHHSEDQHYYPSRGTRVDKCDYIFVPSGQEAPPTGYTYLVSGSDMCVPVTWLESTTALFKNKTRSHCAKLFLNGLYEPQALVNKTASEIMRTPVGKAFQLYCINKLNMECSLVTKAVNTKIHTMARALKLGRVKDC